MSFSRRDCKIKSKYDGYVLFITLLINNIIFNGFYIMFALANYYKSNTSLCQVTGILLHYFFLTTFALIVVFAVLNFLKTIYGSTVVKLYNYISIPVVFCKYSTYICRTIQSSFNLTFMFPSIDGYHSDRRDCNSTRSKQIHD
jgi:hypothetical protein